MCTLHGDDACSSGGGIDHQSWNLGGCLPDDLDVDPVICKDYCDILNAVPLDKQLSWNRHALAKGIRSILGYGNKYQEESTM